MRILAAVLLAVCVLLQYRLWLGSGGMQDVWELRDEIATRRHENEQLRERNRALAAEVQDLKKGTSAVEERARTDLGMVANGETFYQVVESAAPSVPAESPPAAPRPSTNDSGGAVPGSTVVVRQ